ncbi:unnamed protein product, partial [marine sediment metagenome]
MNNEQRTMNFKNRLAIVTGGGQGIGKEICLKLVRSEAKVIIFDVNEESFNKTVEEIRAIEGKILAFKVDVTKYEASKRVILAIPFFPSKSAFSKVSIPIPIGETTPIPVITTR